MVKHTPTLLFVASALLLFRAIPAGAFGPCTDGTDCYCDRVEGGDLNDTLVLLCEDYEAPTLHSAGTCAEDGTTYCTLDSDCSTTCNTNTWFGDGAPAYGPWWDYSGGGFNNGWRGFNSYWFKRFGPTVSSCGFNSLQPASPTLGNPCVEGGVCAAGEEWSAGDPWTANGYQPCIDILKSGEFNDEVATISEPSIPGAGTGPFDGWASMGFRVGAGQESGILGTYNFPRIVTEIGITQAMAFPSNSGSSGIWNAAWKFNEYVTCSAGDGGCATGTPSWEGIAGFHNVSGLVDDAPFKNWFLDHSTATLSTCQTALAAADIRFGDLSCNGSGLLLNPSSSEYSQPSSWPFGEWACIRTHIQGIGTTSLIYQQWLNETIILDFTIDGTWLANRAGYKGVKPDGFANTNQASPYNCGCAGTCGAGCENIGGCNENGYAVVDDPLNGGNGDCFTTCTERGSCTPNTTYRYEDNWHVREGAPVSCDQIGFGGSPVIPAPDASEGVNFNSGINISSILPWFGDSNLEQAIFGGK